VIVVRLAFRSVFRRPIQNLAVIIGIALGVSLFVGIQVSSESLSTTFGTLAQRNLGETEAEIRPILTEFFFDEDILLEATKDIGYNEYLEELAQNLNYNLGSGSNKSLFERIKQSPSLSNYLYAIAERLVLRPLIIEEELGTINVNSRLIGISINETGFGEFYNENNEWLSMSDLEDGEVYIGSTVARRLFGTEIPVNRSLTVSASMLSMPLFPLNITSTIVSWNSTLTVKGVFVDQERGRERNTNFIAVDLNWLQSEIYSTFLNSHYNRTIEEQIENPIIGFGAAPISELKFSWFDDYQERNSRDLVFEQLKTVFEKEIGVLLGQSLKDFYLVINSKSRIEDNISTFNTFFTRTLTVFGSLIAAAAVLVIINIQSMALQAREKETGIFRAIGANKKQIIFSNLIESLFLGLIGSFIGLFGGILYGQALIWFMSWSFGFDSRLISLNISTGILQTSFIWGVIISQVTGLIPAINASRINVAAVLRGLKQFTPKNTGKNTSYLGILIFIIGFIYTLTLDPNPFVNGKSSFANLEDTERIYLGITLILLGPSFLFASLFSKKIGLTAGSVLVSLWAYFNIFIIIGWIENTTTGGLWYVAYIMFSLLGGSILFISVNLDFITLTGEKLTSKMVGTRKTSIRATIMVAFRQMRSKRVRSTLTFALFATILTLNIFIGSWSYSTRYGFDQVIMDISGNTDVIFYSFEPMPKSIDLPTRLMDRFGETEEGLNLELVKPFTLGKTTPIYYNTTKPLEPLGTAPINIISGNQNVMWADSNQDDWLLQFSLQADKTGTDPNYDLEFASEDASEELIREENEKAWEAIFNNKTDENGIPYIIGNILVDGFTLSGPNIVASQADIVYLNTTDGNLQPFKIGAILEPNPITSSLSSLRGGGSSSRASFFVSDYWAERLLAFQGLTETHQIFVGKTSANEINDERIIDLIFDIEFWANSKNGDLRQTLAGKTYGLFGIQTYSVFEQFLEIQYRFFNFLQSFVSLGFIVGILGLLVVSQRSVAERQRQIGMLRALGFKRTGVVFSVVFELIVIGMIGFVLGILNGSVLGYALVSITGEGSAKFLFPWQLILGYGLLTLCSAIIASIFPGIRASKIPPSDALRYLG
jgi:ABC-type antimicrobial peptide transport system permease subunit